MSFLKRLCLLCLFCTTMSFAAKGNIQLSQLIAGSTHIIHAKLSRIEAKALHFRVVEAAKGDVLFRNFQVYLPKLSIENERSHPYKIGDQALLFLVRDYKKATPQFYIFHHPLVGELPVLGKQVICSDICSTPGEDQQKHFGFNWSVEGKAFDMDFFLNTIVEFTHLFNPAYSYKKKKIMTLNVEADYFQLLKYPEKSALHAILYKEIAHLLRKRNR